MNSYDVPPASVRDNQEMHAIWATTSDEARALIYKLDALLMALEPQQQTAVIAQLSAAIRILQIIDNV